MMWKDFQFRLAGFSEVDGIVELWQQYHSNPESKADSKASLIREMAREKQTPELGRSFVVFHNGNVVAWSRWRYFLHAENAPENAIPEGWYLLGVNVLEEMRCCGLGRALTRLRLNQLCDLTQTVYYFTGIENKNSIEFHKVFGFVQSASDVWFPNKLETENSFQLFRLDDWLSNPINLTEHSIKTREQEYIFLKNEIPNVRFDSLANSTCCLYASHNYFDDIKLILDVHFWRRRLEGQVSLQYQSDTGITIHLRHEVV